MSTLKPHFPTKMSAMKLLLMYFILNVFWARKSADALRCIQCRQSHFNGQPGSDECYKVDDDRVRNATNCVVSDSDAYCFTKIELSDGIISYLERGCTNTRQDPARLTNGFPDSAKCTTSYSTSNLSRNSQQTECFLACREDRCNGVPVTDNLKSCPRACPPSSECNYITGKCQCAEDRSGDECNTTAIEHNGRKCVQCNSKTKPSCSDEIVGSQCQGGETHCSTTQTWILRQDGTLADDPVVTRACTGRYVSPDRCYLTTTDDIAVAKYTEYTCLSTCSTDNCNVGNANGVVDKGEFIPMKCVVCEGNELTCGPGRKRTTDCPANTTHCMSTVTYWKSDVTDSSIEGRLKPESAISIRSIKRECASRAVTPECTTKRLGVVSLEEVTCQETCLGDGCNTGWPCRPECVQCEKAGYDSPEEDCIFYPSGAKFCPEPHHQFCYFYLQNRTAYHSGEVKENGKYRAQRGCSATAERQQANKCANIYEHGRVMGLECYYYCSSDGCNFKKNDFYFHEASDQRSGVNFPTCSTLVQIFGFFLALLLLRP